MAHTASDDRSEGKAKPRRRLRTRAIALVGAALAAIGGSAWAYLGDKATEEIESGVDARRLAVDYSIPDNCVISAGWSDPGELLEQVTSGRVSISETVEHTLEMGSYGMVRLHFTLPRTSDLATIDVRAVDVRVSRVAAESPLWVLSEEGCGGAEYHRTYNATVRDGRVRITEITDDGESVEGPFEPFVVDPGEAEFLDYNVTICDQAAYDVVFEVKYSTDTGRESSLRIPEDGAFSLTGRPPATRYAYTGEDIITVGEEFAPVC